MLSPLVILPPMFTTLPKCVLRLSDAVARDIYVLPQHGMLEKIKIPLRNEYTSTDDLESLLKIIDKPVYLVGYSAGAMRAANFVSN